jgi:hypothetical protein
MAVMAIAAGCGGGGDSSSAPASAGGDTSATGESNGGSITTSSLDKEEYIKKASAVCVKERESVLEEMAAWVKSHEGKGNSGAELIVPLTRQVLLPKIEAEIAAVRALGAPEGDEDQIEAILAAQQAAVDEVRSEKKLTSFEEVDTHFKAAGDMYREYGFTACMNG